MLMVIVQSLLGVLPNWQNGITRDLDCYLDNIWIKIISITVYLLKPASHCPILKELDGIGVDWCNLMGFILLRFQPIFSFPHCPKDSMRFLLYLSRNAFREMIEFDNCMQSNRSSFTCQTPSISIRFFKLAYDHPIVCSHCPIFQPISQTIILIGDVGFSMESVPRVHWLTHSSTRAIPSACLEKQFIKLSIQKSFVQSCDLKIWKNMS